MRLMLRLRTTVASLNCRQLRDLCYTVLVVAAGSALLTYHLSRQLPPPSSSRPHRPTAAPVYDARRVLEGLDMDDIRRQPVANVEESFHDDDFDNIDNEVSSNRHRIATYRHCLLG